MAALRATGTTLKGQVPALLTIAKDVAGPAKPLVTALEIIYTRCEGITTNKNQCIELAAFCSEVVVEINKYIPIRESGQATQ